MIVRIIFKSDLDSVVKNNCNCVNAEKYYQTDPKNVIHTTMLKPYLIN